MGRVRGEGLRLRGDMQEQGEAKKPDGNHRIAEKLASLVRDWRIRTLLPVILIHLVAFTALFGYIYRHAIHGVVNDYQQIATSLLNEVEAYFADSMKLHGSQEVRQIFTRQRHYRTISLALLDPSGRVTISTDPTGLPQGELAALVAKSLKEKTAWSGPQGEELWVTGVRRLENLPECRRCHNQEGETLGFVVMRQDISVPLRAAQGRVRSGFAVIATVWLGLLIVMSWLKALVIARPLEQIQESLQAATPGGKVSKYDLEAMAAELQATILQLLRKEQEHENALASSMARAEQLACLGEMAAGLTHEIKNPLAAVMAALETLVQDAKRGEAPQPEILAQMLRELQRAHGTLDRLLTLARPAKPQRVKVDLAKLLREMATLFEPRARRRNITFEVRIPRALPTLEADPDLLSQLFINLVTNAFQATPPNGAIMVSATPFPQGDGVAVMVSDNGCGIPKENLPRVFEPFFTTKEGGTGLGLAIAQQIASQHGGTIRIDSQPGQGTQVLVLLPVQVQRTTEEPQDGIGPAR
ncbi:MAG: ATP-binding protein [Acidobacteriota bacterium]